MNIVVVPSWFRTKNLPTKGSFFLEQAEGLALLGNSVFFLDIQMSSPRDFFRGERTKGIRLYKEKGVTIIEKKTCSFGLSRFPKVYAYLYKNKLNKVLDYIQKRTTIDVLHAHSFYPAGYACVQISKAKGIPCVVTEHYSSVVSNKFDHSFYASMIQFVINNSSVFSAVSNSFANCIKEKYSVNRPIEVTPNQINPFFHFSSPPNPDKCFTFIAIGNLWIGKHIDWILEALSLLIKRKNYNVNLTILGEGTERHHLEEIIEEYAIHDYVQLKGSVSREDTANYLSKSNCLISASTFETFGVVYIEALSTGRPVISISNGGADELIDSSNGIIVPKEKGVNGLCEAMKEMICNYSTYRFEEISDKTITKYNSRTVSGKYMCVYNKAIKASKN